MRAVSSIAGVVGLAACLLWAPIAEGQTLPAEAAPTPRADEASSPALPPLPPPAPEAAASAPATPETLPRVEVAPPAPGRAGDDPSGEDVSTAPASAPPDPWATQPIVAELQFGVGTPLGLAGLAIDYSPIPLLGFNVGVGLGLGGAEYAFASRLRFIRAGHRRHVAVYLGAGLSGGAYNTAYAGPDIAVDGSQGNFEHPVPHYHWDAAFWTNLEAGVEIRIASHLSLRPFVGAAFLVNPNAGVVVIGQRGDLPAPPERWLPYLGLAIGYAVRPW